MEVGGVDITRLDGPHACQERRKKGAVFDQKNAVPTVDPMKKLNSIISGVPFDQFISPG